jgi:hypothetical protein
VRNYKPEDKAFIMSTFLRGLYYGHTHESTNETTKVPNLTRSPVNFQAIPKDSFMESYKIVGEGLINSPNTSVQVACLKDDEDIIVGYSILSADFQTVHWVFVKKAWRLQGIARSLLPQYPTTVTHLTGLGKSLMYKFKNCVFDPFKI